jgi:predicted NBD/HSP70 family sugar kinase
LSIQIKGDGLATLRKAQQTELDILRRVHERPGAARSDLAEDSGLSMAALTGIVNALLVKKLITEDRADSNSAGRRRMALTVHPELGFLVGIDLGTYNLRVVLTRTNGQVVAHDNQLSHMEKGRKWVISHCLELVHALLDQHAVKQKQLLGVGIAFSGVIDVEHGVVLSYPRPGQIQEWRQVPLRDIIAEALGVPCHLEDSVRAIATVEKHLGQGRTLKEFTYVDVGMGIGASLFIHGELYRGFGGSAGEFGHITIDENGPVCCCGSNGCLEAMASGTTIIENARRALERGAPSRMYELLNGRFEDLSIECVAQAAEQGDNLAMRLLAEAGLHIGSAAADLLNLLNPEAIIFGGALFRAAPSMMIEHIDRTIRQKAMEKPTRQAQLLVSQLQSDAGALGMAHMMGGRMLELLFRLAEAS